MKIKSNSYPDYYLYYNDDGIIYEASSVLNNRQHIVLPSAEAYYFMTNELITDWLIKNNKLIQKPVSSTINTLIPFYPVLYKDLDPSLLIYSIDDDDRLPNIISYKNVTANGIYFQ